MSGNAPWDATVEIAFVLGLEKADERSGDQRAQEANLIRDSRLREFRVDFTQSDHKAETLKYWKRAFPDLADELCRIGTEFIKAAYRDIDDANQREKSEAESGE